MERTKKDCPAKSRKYRHAVILLSCMVLILTVGIVGFGLTREKTQKKAQKINVADTEAKNVWCESERVNALKLSEDQEINSIIDQYYKELAQEKGFVEAYNNIKVYTKNGLYKDTYVALARYGMKIKDIYTEVPGLETLFVEKDGTSGEYRINKEELDDQTGKYIESVAKHKDVQSLLTQGRDDYKKAVESDALLREALIDLKNAYDSPNS